jgi:hypothetical protein
MASGETKVQPLPQRTSRSPQLAITLRGLKILEHPKTKPELWGVVVPWVRVRVGGLYVQLFDSNGATVRAEGAFVGKWRSPADASRTMIRLVKRARRHAVDTWQCHHIESAPLTGWTRLGAAVCVCALAGLLGLGMWVLWTVLEREELFSSWHGIVACVLVSSVLGAQASIGAALVYAQLCAALYGARRVEYSPDAIEVEFDRGHEVSIPWNSVRRVMRYGAVTRITDDAGHHYWLPTSRLGFLLDAHADRLDPMRVYRRSTKAAVVRLVIVMEIGAIAAALLLSRLRRDVPDMPPNLPLSTWLLFGVVMPAVLLISVRLDPWIRARVRHRQQRSRQRGRRNCQGPANPAG